MKHEEQQVLKRGHIKESVNELIGFGDGRNLYNGKELALTLQGAEEDLTWIALSRSVVTVGKGEKQLIGGKTRHDGKYCSGSFSVDFKHTCEN